MFTFLSKTCVFFVNFIMPLSYNGKTLKWSDCSLYWCTKLRIYTIIIHHESRTSTNNHFKLTSKMNSTACFYFHYFLVRCRTINNNFLMGTVQEIFKSKLLLLYESIHGISVMVMPIDLIFNHRTYKYRVRHNYGNQGLMERYTFNSLSVNLTRG